MKEKSEIFNLSNNLDQIHQAMLKTPDIHQYKKLDSGIGIMLLDTHSANLTKTETIIEEAPIEFSLYLSGNIEGILYYDSQIEHIPIHPGLFQITYLPNTRCQVNVPGNQRIRSINFYASRSCLNQLLNENLDSLPTTLVKIIEGTYHRPYNFVGEMVPKMRIALDQFLNCPFGGAIREVFLKSKVQELISLQLFEACEKKKRTRKHVKLNRLEISRIHDAQQILVRDLSRPLSIQNLAEKSGLSDYKLKAGFHQIYGKTIFEYFRLNRITQSKNLLENTSMSVTEIAHHLGYHDAAHFIKEFSKKFNTTPGLYQDCYLQLN